MTRTPPGASEETVSLSRAPAISGRTVVLTLQSPLALPDASVKVSYRAPANTGSRLRDLAGNEVRDFIDRTDDTQPRLVRGEIDGGTVTLYFSEDLDENSVGGGMYVNARLSLGYSQSFSATGEMTVKGNAVSMDLGEGRRTVAGATAWADFYNPLDSNAQRIRDLAGNAVWTPVHRGADPHGNIRWGTRTITLDNLTE